MEYNQTPDCGAPKELLNIGSLGISLVIVNGDIILADSGAIVAYLIDRYGKDKSQLPESGRLGDLYCEIVTCVTIPLIIVFAITVTHYSGGSLPP
ncbi:hypothetical protein BJ138DRAFT_1153129 [Hygrophoropsis aurantiaca]|uniref:Uncharacterized protein n=1 Tax=Hygrophoropsis aurantiaca TaxID=72124 RepID=A0ACB8AAX1_9AGAM|nr:hypothetical protein BJ138DRAFT_1153129 [Hygrophoropsis aurantiaca]